ncbi:MAG: universal stress protein [Candidatus Binatia bacterium]
MDKIKTILAPTDFSELSQGGVRYALEMAEFQGAEVIIFHVADYTDIIPFSELRSPHLKSVQEYLNDRSTEVDKFLRETFPELISKVKIHVEVDIGTPHKKILERASKKGVDMIVMSTHGRDGVAHMLIGSVTEHVVRRSPCPVLSVRPQTEAMTAEARAV